MTEEPKKLFAAPPLLPEKHEHGHGALAAEKKARKNERARWYREYCKLRDEFSVGDGKECCNTCDFSVPYDEYGKGFVLCVDKSELRTKENVCLDWDPKENKQ